MKPLKNFEEFESQILTLQESDIESGLKKIGFSDSETHGILGNNWYNFYKSI